MFRHPILSASTYLDLYAQGTADEWSADSGRQDLATIRGIISQKVGFRGVLDVGCGNGDFLSTLPAALPKYGVEPSLAAAAAARNRGVTILAPTLGELDAASRFDTITMIDVIEHVEDPGTLLDQAFSHVAPGGSLFIATGDASNKLWRKIFRSRFWYSSFPEHISFPSLRYFQIWRQGTNSREPVAIRLKYRRLPHWQAAFYAASQIVYWFSPELLNYVGRSIEWMRGAPRPKRRFFSPGAPGVFTDHHIVIIERSI